LKDETGGSRWANAYLREVNEGGASIALMTQLEIGSQVVIQGNLGEGRSDVRMDAEVKWCTRGTGGVFNVGLKFAGKSSDQTVEGAGGDGRS